MSALVPIYLAAVPADPYTGAPFRYRISTGETLPYAVPMPAGPGGAVVATGSIYLIADLVRDPGVARASTL